MTSILIYGAAAAILILIYMVREVKNRPPDKRNRETERAARMLSSKAPILLTPEAEEAIRRQKRHTFWVTQPRNPPAQSVRIEAYDTRTGKRKVYFVANPVVAGLRNVCKN